MLLHITIIIIIIILKHVKHGIDWSFIPNML